MRAGEHTALGRRLRQTPSGRLVIDKAEITAEARLDGKYLLSNSDPDLSAEDVALGYKNLLEAERGFRDLKSTIELRPVFHRLEPSIRAHLLLCWLALLLIRVAERRTGDDLAAHQPRAGPAARDHPRRAGRDGCSDTEPTTAQSSILRASHSPHRPGSPPSTPPEQQNALTRPRARAWTHARLVATHPFFQVTPQIRVSRLPTNCGTRAAAAPCDTLARLQVGRFTMEAVGQVRGVR